MNYEATEQFSHQIEQLGELSTEQLRTRARVYLPRRNQIRLSKLLAIDRDGRLSAEEKTR
jgi:hypothetical protein